MKSIKQLLILIEIYWLWNNIVKITHWFTWGTWWKKYHSPDEQKFSYESKEYNSKSTTKWITVITGILIHQRWDNGLRVETSTQASFQKHITLISDSDWFIT